MNPTIRPLFATLFAAGALGVAVANAADRKPPQAEIPPPPGLNDAGVTTPATAKDPGDATAAPAAQADTDPLAPLPKPDARLVRDKASRNAAATTQRIATSQVTTRKQGNDTVEEYRESGHVWMIKIVPQNGPTQTFLDNDGSGRLSRDPNEGPVSPVYYTLYEWK